MTLRVYGAPLADIRVDKVTTNDVLRCLGPIWTSKNEAARRTRGRMSRGPRTGPDAFRICYYRTAPSDGMLLPFLPIALMTSLMTAPPSMVV
jgi:hypothetical protein